MTSANHAWAEEEPQTARMVRIVRIDPCAPYDPCHLWSVACD
jgi:hypothetical protein